MIAPNAQERLTQIVEPLLFWYQKNKRSLPWRDQPTPTVCGYRRSCSSKPG